MSVQAITFDFWNTLCLEAAPADGSNVRSQRISAWLGVLEDAGFAVERAALDKAMADSWDRFQESWKANQQYTAIDAAIDIVERLGYRLPPETHDTLAATFTYATEHFPSLAPGVADALRDLRRAGVKIGIVCDVGMTPSRVLRDILRHHEVLDLFDGWSFSDEVGWYKPARQIFEHALQGLGGVDPAAAAHIGDLKRTDIAGAQAMGMLAIRYTGGFDDAESEGPEGDFVINHHDELLAILGLT